MKCRNLNEQPASTKSIVYQRSLSHCFGTPYTISYSFDITPFIHSLKATILAEGYVGKVEDVLIMNESTRALLKKAQQMWEAVARVKFVEDKMPDVLAFSYHPTGRLGNSIKGFAKMPGQSNRYIGISTSVDDHLNSPLTLRVMLHELGHLAGIDHPWIKKLLTSPFHNTTSFSIMNYNSEYTVERHLYSLAVEPNTPMPADIRAMQFIFGANEETNTGNQIYYLRDYAPANKLSVFDPVSYTTISSLPWDASGEDTFSAEGLNNDVVMNIRGGGVSKVRHVYTATPFMALENVVSGDGCHAIVLNPLDNHVDIARSRLSLLFFAPPNTGKDTVIGFKPKHDVIVLEQDKFSTQLTWSISLDTSSTANYSTTLLKFNDNNFVRLIGVHPSELTPNSISVRHTYNTTQSGVRHANDYMRNLMNARSNQELKSLLEYLYAVGKISIGSIGLSGSALILRIVLKQSQLLQHHLELSNMVATSLPMVLTGEFKTAGMTVATQLMFDESSALHFTAGIMLGSIALQSSSLTDFAINVAHAATVAATGYLTAKFTFWAYDTAFGEPEPTVQPAAPAPAGK